jgi:hypothetical protein
MAEFSASFGLLVVEFSVNPLGMSSFGLVQRKRLGKSAANSTSLPLNSTTRLPHVEQNLTF